jgi:hypothetical protein
MRSPGVVLAALCACIPPEPPAWVVTRPEIWGMRADVVAAGPYTDLLLVPPGYSRAEAFPGDTIEWRWTTAAPPGVAVHPPVWIACRNFVVDDCVAFLDGPLEDCPSPLPILLPAPCRLGAGERVSVALADLSEIPPDFWWPGVTVVAVGGFDDTDGETCLRRLLRAPRVDLDTCLFGQWQLDFGPRALLSFFAPDVGPWPPGALTQALLEQPADFHPTLVWFTVDRGDGPVVVADGDVVPVAPGDPIVVRPEFNAGAEQDYFNVSADDTMPGCVAVVLARERLRLDAALTAEADDFAVDADAREVRWTAPEVPELHLFVKATDGRQGQAFGALRFTLAGAP